MTEYEYLNPNTILEDPRVNNTYVQWRWRDKIPSYVKVYIASDLADYEEMKGGVNINCTFYKPVSITHEAVFHHASPEWKIRMVEEKSGKEVDVRYTMKKFYIGKDEFTNELRENKNLKQSE